MLFGYAVIKLARHTAIALLRNAVIKLPRYTDMALLGYAVTVLYKDVKTQVFRYIDLLLHSYKDSQV